MLLVMLPALCIVFDSHRNAQGIPIRRDVASKGRQIPASAQRTPAGPWDSAPSSPRIGTSTGAGAGTGLVKSSSSPQPVDSSTAGLRITASGSPGSNSSAYADSNGSSASMDAVLPATVGARSVSDTALTAAPAGTAAASGNRVVRVVRTTVTRRVVKKKTRVIGHMPEAGGDDDGAGE